MYRILLQSSDLSRIEDNHGMSLSSCENREIVVIDYHLRCDDDGITYPRSTFKPHQIHTR